MRPAVVVIGGGIAGAAAALRSVQYHLPTLWLMGDAQTAKASRAKYVYNIDNMIGIHPGIIQGQLAEMLEGKGQPDAAQLVRDEHLHITTVDVVANTRMRMETEFPQFIDARAEAVRSAERTDAGFAFTTDEGRHEAPYAVLATGVMDRQPTIKLTTKAGKVRDDIKWIYPYANHESILYCIRCEGHLTRDTPTAVIGHTASAPYIATMLHERYETKVVLLTNGEEPDITPDMRARLDQYGIDIYTSRIVSFTDDGWSQKGSALRGIGLEDGTELEVWFGFVSMGLYAIYNELAAQLGAELVDDHVLVDDAASETTVHNFFAVGDVSRRKIGPNYKQIYTAQEYAVRALDTIDARARRERRAQSSKTT